MFYVFVLLLMTNNIHCMKPDGKARFIRRQLFNSVVNNNFQETLSLIGDKKITKQDITTLLFFASTLEMTELLVRHGGNLNEKRDGLTLLHKNAQTPGESTHLTRYYLKNCNNISHQNSSGTPLHMLAKHSSCYKDHAANLLEKASLFIDKIPANATNSGGKTALDCAIDEIRAKNYLPAKQCIDLTILLYDKGARVASVIR